MAVVEVKYFNSGENDAADSVRAAASQLVRYTRGYRAMEEIETILGSFNYRRGSWRNKVDAWGKAFRSSISG